MSADAVDAGRGLSHRAIGVGATLVVVLAGVFGAMAFASVPRGFDVSLVQPPFRIEEPRTDYVPLSLASGSVVTRVRTGNAMIRRVDVGLGIGGDVADDLVVRVRLVEERSGRTLTEASREIPGKGERWIVVGFPEYDPVQTTDVEVALVGASARAADVVLLGVGPDFVPGTGIVHERSASVPVDVNDAMVATWTYEVTAPGRVDLMIRRLGARWFSGADMVIYVAGVLTFLATIVATAMLLGFALKGQTRIQQVAFLTTTVGACLPVVAGILALR